MHAQQLRTADHKIAGEREATLVLSLTGERLGEFGRFAGDRFSMRTPAGQTLWLTASAVYLERPMYVELICLADGLGRYVVDPPASRRAHQRN